AAAADDERGPPRRASGESRMRLPLLEDVADGVEGECGRPPARRPAPAASGAPSLSTKMVGTPPGHLEGGEPRGITAQVVSRPSRYTKVALVEVHRPVYIRVRRSEKNRCSRGPALDEVHRPVYVHGGRTERTKPCPLRSN